MTEFMCQLDCPDIWSYVILGVPLRVFLDEVNIEISRLSKQTALPNVGGPHLIS